MPIEASLELANREAAEATLKMIESGLQLVPDLLDQAEAQVSTIDMDEMQEVAKSTFDIARRAAENLKLSLDDSTVHAKLEETEGVPQLPLYFAKMLSFQLQMFEAMPAPEVRIR